MCLMRKRVEKYCIFLDCIIIIVIVVVVVFVVVVDVVVVVVVVVVVDDIIFVVDTVTCDTVDFAAIFKCV